MTSRHSDTTDTAPHAPAPEGKVTAKLERAARELALGHYVAAHRDTKPLLLYRLPEQERLLRQAYEHFLQASEEELAFSYAAEWLLDNFYLIQQSWRQIRQDLPPRFYGELPKLEESADQPGLPRIYDVARRYLLHDECQLDLERLKRFVRAYETIQPFTMGELWALPIMLRFAVLESLAQAVGRLTSSSFSLQPSAFSLSYEMSDADLIANCIPALRTLNSQDWKTFFESISLVEQELGRDPAQIYHRMDFETRDQYRKIVEEMALASGRDELEVAQLAVQLAHEKLGIHTPTTTGRPSDDGAGDQGSASSWSGLDLPRTTHVGFYLLGRGLSELEHRLNYSPTGWARLRRWLFSQPTPVYLGSVSLVTLLIVSALLSYALVAGATGLQLLAVAALTFIPALTLAVSLVNQVVTSAISPRILPKLDFQDGIPASRRTMVVIPAILTSPEEVDSLLTQLELHYLRNPDGRLGFSLLTDFADAPAADMIEDDELVAQAVAGIEALNERHPRKPFFLFHRRRLWNPAEGVWMGWERKRGKLHEFNRLIRGDTSTSFTIQIGQLSLLPDIRYVITLDADTVLPRDSARRLVATLAHPLNRPEFQPGTSQVIAGYIVLQPRTEIKPTSANRSLFTRVFAGDTGLDLYSRAVSDVYQDLFGEGIYVGKGIYDVDAFERSLAGRIPENTLLSHDLFEGIHGRAGLVTDVIIYEDYPHHYLVHIRRSHRWIRGDWQLLPWLLPLVPHASGQKIVNPLRAIDLWKIADNLRRSLLPPALMFLLLAGWTWLPGSPHLWTLFAVIVPATSLIGNVAGGLARLFSRKLTVSRKMAPRELLRTLGDNALRWLLALAFLPYETILTLDAILTTLVRLFITRRRMLQWTTAAHTARIFGDEIRAELTRKQMISGLLVSVTLALFVYAVNPPALPVAAPLLIAWLLSPEIAYLISRPIAYRRDELTDAQRQTLRRLARRTWFFFEQFVGPDDNWLPPDHFQESPRGTVAHRTSPTNLGLLLTSTLAAYDLGYVDALELALRLRSTFDTLPRLERYRGHFLNWIDTRTLAPLNPRYVSTVDSGNLAACLWTLGQACQGIGQDPAFRWQRWQALLDTLELVLSALAEADSSEKRRKTNDQQPALRLPKVPMTKRLDDDATSRLNDHLAHLRLEILAVRDQPQEWAPLLAYIVNDNWRQFDRLLLEWIENKGHSLNAEPLRDLHAYVQRVLHHLQSMQRELDLVMPWLLHLNRSPALFRQPDLDPAVRQAWQALLELLPTELPLSEVAHACQAAREKLTDLARLLPEEGQPAVEVQAWRQELAAKLQATQTRLESLFISYDGICQEANRYVEEMDFRFLYDRQRRVFHIGYNLDTARLDNSYYDLLASESRIASIIAIAKHDVPQSHWLHLGRPLTRVPDGQVLLSWSGTMFEYLMPLLHMHTYEGTLLNQSLYTAIQHQMAYGRQHGLPWGISESGYYAFDANMNYQYRAFGVPGLGFKRGLGEDVVVSPYACLLALSAPGGEPQPVLDNLEHLARLQMLGRYGFYEAVDFTPTRLPMGQEQAIVRAYMAHHQGMILMSLVNVLQDNAMVHRFHADPRVQTIELLLQERIPDQAPLEYPTDEDVPALRPSQAVTIAPWPVPVDTATPQVHYLSNGRYGLLLTNAGAGQSRWQDLALTRWRADTTLDNWGCWLYLRDEASGALWSAGYQPTTARPEGGPGAIDVHFHPHMVEFHRRDHGISLHMEIIVAPDDDVEIRRLELTNDSDQARQLSLTSYGEVVLAPQADDERHPAFAKLFVESEYLPNLSVLLFRRRPRSAEEEPAFLVHTLVVDPALSSLALSEGEREAEMEVEEETEGVTSAYESDRARFLGRGRTAAAPAALGGEWQTRPLADSQTAEDGTPSTTLRPRLRDRPLAHSPLAPLDPIFALGQTIELPARASAKFALVTAAAPSRDEALTLAERFRTWSTLDRAFVQAHLRSDRELRHLGLETPALAAIQQLLSLLLYPSAARRGEPSLLAANTSGQSGLWSYGISGDYPILLVRINQQKELPLLQELLLAHTYWRRRGLKVDLVILNQEETHYGQDLQGYLLRLVHRANSSHWLNRRGGIFVLLGDQMSEADRILLHSAARVVLDGSRGGLSEQIEGLYQQPLRLPEYLPTLPDDQRPTTSDQPRRPDNLQFDNGLGGFSPDGREYVIYLQPGQPGGGTPTPWINVIANPDFGFLVSEAGSGYTWSINSGENRLTPWHNDPVSDTPGEVLYLRDEETAVVWSPTPQPAPAPAGAPYLVRHGAGYTIFEHHSYDLKQRLRLFAAPDAPLKVVQLRLENTGPRPRRITATYYVEWVLGVNRATSQPYVLSEYDEEFRALLVRNPYNVEFGQRVAFVATNKDPHGLTADRTEFLGRMGSLRKPAGLTRIGLENRVEPGLDSCAAVQLHLDLAPGESEEVYFLIGQGADRAEARVLLGQYKEAGEVAAAWQRVQETWEEILSTVTVRTPDPAMDLLLNRWLLYQTLACRLWGRSALYQSSGAYGFRDQLQDVTALIYARPDLARQHILRAARHQFQEGDVLHWWHPPSARGVRTRITDDLLWLPYVTAYYVTVTGDKSILDEKAPFLQGEPLEGGEEERYGHYESTEEAYTIYEHCCRTLDRGDTAGRHKLPLMGGGDWNDGMNRVGIGGEGESVWLGWFLHTTLVDFARVCECIGQEEQATSYRERAEELRQALEANGWDGQWYLRAYYDDATPMGSATNRECQIDSLSQSWAVLSGAADPGRARQAMAAVLERLVKWDERLILLFTPPFDKTTRDPGYIKGYLPGIRENGGQYTHAALWTIWALTELGDGDQTQALFDLINPIKRADDPEKVALYKAEPYVISADVYGVPPHIGRGGWTWYTGSSGWMYRLGVEAILGLRRVGQSLQIQPCIPRHWPSYSLSYCHGRSLYQIRVENPNRVNRGVKQVTLDGQVLSDGAIPLQDDGQQHEVVVLLGE